MGGGFLPGGEVEMLEVAVVLEVDILEVVDCFGGEVEGRGFVLKADGFTSF